MKIVHSFSKVTSSILKGVNPDEVQQQETSTLCYNLHLHSMKKIKKTPSVGICTSKAKLSPQLSYSKHSSQRGLNGTGTATT